MSAPSLAWPALAGSPPTTLLAYERGVWGKAHGAASDFRWLAGSPGFAPGDLGRQLNLGPEDRPERATFWRSLGARCYAGVFYPSRAVDAAGRQGSLEKQVFEWVRPAALPAALAALALLPRVEELDDDIWWGRRGEAAWERAEFLLPIAPLDLLEVRLTEEEAEQAVAQGIAELAAAAGEAALAGLYAQLLSEQRPACLAGLLRPLAPRALAALLLPLPRDLADRLSLTAWVPSSRPSPTQLAAAWDVLVAPSSPAPPAPTAEVMRRATDLARALLGNDPAPLLGSSGRPDGALSGPETPAVPMDDPAPESALVPTPASPSLRPVFHLPLTPPPTSAPAVVVALFDFAADPARRWLGSLPGLEPLPAGDPAERVLCGWIAELGACRGDADREQWGVKLDLLRSAALALVPTAETLDRVGKPAGDRIPPLHFAAACGSRGYDLLRRLGEGALRRVLEASLACKTDTLRRQVRGWLALAMAEGRLPAAAQRLIRDTLARYPEG